MCSYLNISYPSSECLLKLTKAPIMLTVGWHRCWRVSREWEITVSRFKSIIRKLTPFDETGRKCPFNFRLSGFGNIQENSEKVFFSKETRLCTIKYPEHRHHCQKHPKTAVLRENLAKLTADVNLQYRRLFSSNRIFFLNITENVDVALSAANNKMSSHKIDFARRSKHLLSLVPRDAVTQLSSACKHRVSGTQSHVSTTCTQRYAYQKHAAAVWRVWNLMQ